MTEVNYYLAAGITILLQAISLVIEVPCKMETITELLSMTLHGQEASHVYDWFLDNWLFTLMQNLLFN